MAIRILARESPTHEIRDDLESFFWLLLYCALRYIEHGYVDSVEKKLNWIFFQHHELDTTDTAYGGFGKTDFIAGKIVNFEKCVDGWGKPLTKLLRKARRMVKELVDFDSKTDLSDSSDDEREASVSSFSVPSSSASQPAARVKKLLLEDHEKMDELFRDALAAKDWPSDPAHDYQADSKKTRKDEANTSQKDFNNDRSSQTKRKSMTDGTFSRSSKKPRT